MISPRKIMDLGIEGSYFGEGTYGGYRMQQNPVEFAPYVNFLLGHFASSPPLGFTYLEIGIGAGGTLRFMAENFPFARVGYADLMTPGEFEPERTQNLAALADRANVFYTLNPFHGDSHSREFFEWLAKTFPKNSVDLVFIDGDHSYHGVERDTRNLLDCVKPGGVMVFHDSIVWRRDPPHLCHVPAWIANLDNSELIYLQPVAKFEHRLGIAVYEKIT